MRPQANFDSQLTERPDACAIYLTPLLARTILLGNGA